MRRQRVDLTVLMADPTSLAAKCPIVKMPQHVTPSAPLPAHSRGPRRLPRTRACSSIPRSCAGYTTTSVIRSRRHTGPVPNDDVHPDLRRIARFAPRQLVGPRSLRVIRVLSGLIQRRWASDVEAITLKSGIGVRLFRPVGVAQEPTPALLWIHGGGYVIGTAQQDDVLCRRFSTKLGITVASVDYRLAPEHPYPAPLDDCYEALAWLAGLPAVDSARVAIGGASAGGSLAAALALLARDRGEITPAFQLLAYPMLDDRSSSTSRAPANPNQRMWSPRSNQFGWAAYLGDADPQVAVPARQDDLSGLPPA